MIESPVGLRELFFFALKYLSSANVISRYTRTAKTMVKRGVR